MDQDQGIMRVGFRRLKIFFTLLWSGLRIISFRDYWKDSYMRIALIFSALSNAFSWIYPLWHRPGGEGTVILHYNFSVGVDFTGRFDLIFTLPLTGFLILFFNALLSSAFYREERLAAYLLTVSAMLTQFFLALAIYLLVTINI